MSGPIRTSAVALAIVLYALAAATGRAQLSEQAVFSAEDDTARNAVAVPAAVMALLCEDEQVKVALDYARLEPGYLPQEWFRATAVRLDDAGEQALMVKGRDLLTSANVASFWLYRRTAQGYEQILNLAAHRIEFSAHSTKGLHDLQAYAMTANKIHTTLYQFDGDRYQVTRDEWKPIQ